MRRVGTLVLVMLVSLPFSVGAQDARLPEIDKEKLRQSLNFLRSFERSACIQSEGCQSVMREMGPQFRFSDIVDSLRGIPDAYQFVEALRRTEADLRTLIRQQQISASLLQAQNDQAALVVLRDHNFGFSGSGIVDVFKQQFQATGNSRDTGQERTIFTVFGYFSYTREVALDDGEEHSVKLRFQPFVFEQGTNVGHALSGYMSDSKVNIEPELRLKTTAVDIVTHPTPLARPLHPLNATEWSWTVKQPWFAWFQKGEGEIMLRLFSAETGQSVNPPALSIQLHGRPWWWVVKWLWERALAMWTALPLLIAAGLVWYRKGVKGLLRWIWARLRREEARP